MASSVECVVNFDYTGTCFSTPTTLFLLPTQHAIWSVAMFFLQICEMSVIAISCFRLLWPPYGIWQTIIVCPVDSSIFYLSSFSFFLRRISAVADWISSILLHMVWPYSANLKCKSEMCCTRLAGNAGPKKSPKIRHLGTIAQPCWAISSQLRYGSTTGKKLVKQQYLLHMCSQYGERRPTNG